nr:MAG TPA: helix-turn-helix domain protein [Caudoviricetes sp.]
MGQCERVLKYMQDFDTINPLQALGDLGVMRLGARIWDLRHQGHQISRRMVTGKNRYGEAVSYAEYRLEDNNAE